MKHLEVAVAIIFRDFKVLIARRKHDGVLGGYWEFPGGKREPGESLEHCLRREIQEELGVGIQPVVCFAPIHHQYLDRHVTLHPFLCTHDSGEPQPLACDELRWVPPAELRTYQFPSANESLIEQLLGCFPTTTDKLELTLPQRHASAVRKLAAVK